MSTYTYTVSGNSYSIFQDGTPLIYQAFPRGTEGTTPFASAAAAEAEAQAVVAELSTPPA
jgi:hypothetical protein